MDQHAQARQIEEYATLCPKFERSESCEDLLNEVLQLVTKNRDDALSVAKITHVDHKQNAAIPELQLIKSHNLIEARIQRRSGQPATIVYISDGGDKPL